MSSFALKLLALASMIIDHGSHVLWNCGCMENYNLYLLLRGIGRLAMPIYAFLLVKGIKHTKDSRAYLERLMLYALLSQIPFTLCFAGQNYGASLQGALSLQFAYGWEALLLLLPLAVHVCYHGPGLSLLLQACFLLLPGIRLSIGSLALLDGEMNIFYTLAGALALLVCAERARSISRPERGRLWFTAVAAILPFLLIIQPHADYALKGILLVVLLYVCEERQWAQTLAVLLWSVLEYIYDVSLFTAAVFALLAAVEFLLLKNKGRRWLVAGVLIWAAVCCRLTIYGLFILPVSAALAALPMLYYSGKPGIKIKTAFYAAYPVHLSILFIISTFL